MRECIFNSSPLRFLEVQGWPQGRPKALCLPKSYASVCVRSLNANENFFESFQTENGKINDGSENKVSDPCSLSFSLFASTEAFHSRLAFVGTFFDFLACCVGVFNYKHRLMKGNIIDKIARLSANHIPFRLSFNSDFLRQQLGSINRNLRIYK